MKKHDPRIHFALVCGAKVSQSISSTVFTERSSIGKIKVNNALADRQVEREICVFFFNFVSFFFTVGTCLRISKVSCRSLQKL